MTTEFIVDGVHFQAWTAKEAFDLNQETAATRRNYGLEEEECEFGSRCLIARRLVERGVRFVQLYTSTQQWDHHGAVLHAHAARLRGEGF